MRHSRAGDILDPTLLSQIGNLKLRARLLVEGFLTGLHQSPYHGFSTEFFDRRSYQPTDPLRSVDWRVFARTDKLYVKRYSDETNLRAYLVVDFSRSMAYQGSGPVAKLEYARTLAAAIAFLLLRQRDAVGLAVFDETLRAWIRPSARPGQLDLIATQLARHQPHGTTAPSKVFPVVASRMARRGMVILISDLLVPPEDMASLPTLAAGHHELVVFRILDPAERTLAFRGPVTLRDMETSREITTFTSAIQAHYRAALEEAWDRVVADTERFRASLHDVDTTTPPARLLTSVLASRGRTK